MRKSKAVAIIQARMSSTRLPGKVLRPLGGKPAILHVIQRAKAIPGVHEVVVAVPKGSTDDPLRDYLKGVSGISVYSGSEDDVLDRYYQAARGRGAEIVLRVTADCPLLDPRVGGQVLQKLVDSDADYCSNTLILSYPDGLDVEAMRMGALKTAWKSAKGRSEREHVTPFIRNHPERFRIVGVTSGQDLSHHRWTLDQKEDLEFLEAVYGHLNGDARDMGYERVLAVLSREESLREINAGILPNEGYYKSLLSDAPIRPKRLRLTRSAELLKKARELIPCASQTFSKAPNQFVRGAVPLFMRRGKGCQVWDVDGNRYLDTTMGLAPVSLGYADPDVNRAVREQLEDGTVLSQPHPLEAEVARLLTELIPCAEMVRFGKNGSDVTSAAVRLARAHTGKDIIAAGGYHGWQDWFIGTTTLNRGVPRAVRELTKTFKYNDIKSLGKIFKEHRGNVAAVILEPIGVEEPREGFLQELAALTRKNGALLIFDEVVTGFRVALGGAQEFYGVTPDLACFGKAMANGFPLSAVLGRKDVMRLFEEVFFSFTFGGELASLTACRATIDKMRKHNVIASLWHQGRRLRDGFNTMAEQTGIQRHARCIGLPPHSVATFKKDSGDDWWELKSLFQQECASRGLLFSGAHNLCWAHGEREVEEVLRIYASVFRVVAEAVTRRRVAQKLKGPPVEPVFRKP